MLPLLPGMRPRRFGAQHDDPAAIARLPRFADFLVGTPQHRALRAHFEKHPPMLQAYYPELVN